MPWWCRIGVCDAMFSLMMFFWVLVPCRLVGRCQRFGETYCLHLQGWSLHRCENIKSRPLVCFWALLLSHCNVKNQFRICMYVTANGWSSGTIRFAAFGNSWFRLPQKLIGGSSLKLKSRGSSVSLTTDWTTGVRSPTEAEDFSSSLCVQTGSGAHLASCTMCTGGSFPGGKAQPGRDADHSPPSRLRLSRSYTSSHPMRLHGV
jgi:hypothetical protein